MREINLESERAFENRKAIGDSPRGAQQKFYWATALPTDRHRTRTYKAIEGKDVLEVGCASGSHAQLYVKHANSYVGIDISDEAITNAAALDLPRARFICTDGHQIPESDSSFDAVIVNSLLHHLDLGTALAEISRVLRYDGTLIFLEPLGTNPAFQLYRLLTPSARTEDERPFTRKDLELFERHFAFEDVEWFGFTSVVSGFLGNPRLRSVLTTTDQQLSRTPLKYLYWQIAGVARKVSHDHT